MRVKFFFCFLFLFLSFNCFASTAVGDYIRVIDSYGYINIDEVYVAKSTGCYVKESPDKSSRTIIKLPAGTCVRIMSVNGPSYAAKDWRGSYYEESWAAIYLPENLRENGNQIGWISSADETWWSAPVFSTDQWEDRNLKCYLETSMWEYIVYNSGSEINHGICDFYNGKVDCYEQNGNHLTGTYLEVSGESLKFISNPISAATGLVRINIREYSFSYDEDSRHVEFRKIHPGSKYYIGNVLNDDEVYKFLIDKSKMNFRMMTKDYYSGRTCAQIALQKKDTDDNLLAYAIGNGSYVDNSLCREFWKPILTKCEDSCTSGKYIFKGIEYNCIYLKKGMSYVTKERLRLRQGEKTSSEIITTMAADTVVKILGFGETEAIDGTISNWVQVELNDGTTGWCFGGYLGEYN